jgi:RND family efflux transporter MFP subunit
MRRARKGGAVVIGTGFIRVLIAPVLAVAIGTGIGVWQVSADSAPASTPVARAVKGDLVVSVGGVGRIVQASSSAQIAVPSTTGGGGAAGTTASGSGSSAPGNASGGAATAPADGLFPRTSGRIVRFLVAPGDHVVAGQRLALLDDASTAATSTALARNDVETALLDVLQKRTSDPSKGLPPTPAELAAGRLAVASALAGLGRLLGPPRPADVSAAQSDVKRAQADLETLLGGTPAARARAIRLAQLNVQLSEERLARLLAPPDPADVSAAKSEVKKAEADLALLLRPPAGPLPEQVAAAKQAVAVAQRKLNDAKATGDPGKIDVAQLELDQAQADLATLLSAPRGPLPEELQAARQAVDAARAKLAKLLSPANPADVKSARLELERARAELQTLRAGPSRAALAAARQAIRAFRAKLAQLLGPPLKADVALARFDVGKAKADLAVLRTRGAPASPIDIAIARLKVAAARVRLAAARFDSELLTVRAPRAGTVTALLTRPGAPVDPSTPILAVDNLARLAVTVDLSEFDVARVKPGLSATVDVDALGGRAFDGKVLFAALTGTDTNGVVTFPVQVGLDEIQGLKPGMSVSVHIVVAQRRNVVQVPLEAVSRNDEDNPIVTTINSAGESVERKVTLGLSNNKNVQIVKGLRAGQIIELPEAQGGEE